jgi:hypothetical protein
MVEGDTVPPLPTSGQILLYAKTSGTFYSLNSTGTETPLGGGTGVPTFSGGTTGLTPASATSGAITLGGTLGVANGGTGATSATAARNALLPSQTGNAGRYLTTDGTNVSWAVVTGTVTSVSVTSANGVSGSVLNPTTTPAISLTLGAITPTSVAATGTVTGTNLSGTNTGDQTISLTGDVTGSGTGSFATTLSNTGVSANTYGSATQVPQLTVDAKGRITGVTNVTISAGTGTVTSVAVTGGTTGFIFTGSPITTAGSLAMAGTLNIGAGGTGQTTASGAINALLPSQTGNAGRFLTTNGSAASWATVTGTGTVTSVGATGANGVSISGSPITTSGSLTIGLGAITPTSVAATGTVTGSNLSGTNTGNQTITLTGDVTGSGTGSFAATLSNTGVSANTYGDATNVPQFTVDAKGRISSVTNVPVTGGSSTPEIVVFNYSSGGSGNFTAGDAIYSETAGVTTVITDGTNCIATYTFTGKSNPPKSIITYGQNYGANVFNIKDTTSLPSTSNSVVGGGTAAVPDLANGIFTTTNIVTLQTRMSDTTASAGLGQRAWLVVVFGF